MRSYMKLTVLALAASTISPGLSAPGQPCSGCMPTQQEYECIPMLLGMSLIFMLVPEGMELNRTRMQSRREGPARRRT
jgi:hypothetical protein